MKIRTLAILILVLALSTLVPAQNAPKADYDILIKNGLVYDGSLDPPARLDVAVKGDRIVKVAPSIAGSAARVIDASGMIVTPGFIDLHTHVDEGMYFPENRACLNFLLQGVTSVIVGQCGGSAWPIFEKAEDLIGTWTREGIGPNAALLVGHGQVRKIVMGMENRAPTPDELEKMKALVKEAMDQGASGFSTGLIYTPGSYSKTDEVIELAKVVAPYGGIYHTHIRNERDKLIEAVKEAIQISETAGLPTHISHFKVMGRANWGLVKEACAVIEAAQARGLKITADQYPYRFTNGYPYSPLVPRAGWASGTPSERVSTADISRVFDKLSDAELIDLYKKVTPYTPISERQMGFLTGLPHGRLVQYVAPFLLEPSSFQGAENMRERELFLRRMADPAEGAKIRQQVRAAIDSNLGPENYVVGVCAEKNLEGKTLAEVAALKGKSVEDAAIELDLMGAKCIPLQMCEPDIETIMAKDWVGTGSDAISPPYGVGLVHIRAYTTFPRKIKNYVLDKPVITMSHAIRSMTSLPARIMKWDDRGWIKEGYLADIAVIDLAKIETPATISNPQQYSKGVDTLLINGVAAIEKGAFTGKLPGKVLKLKRAVAKAPAP
jgi:N-acyl-D-aspartate/D-glutamate deacylase